MSDLDEAERLLRKALGTLPNNDWPGNPYQEIKAFLERRRAHREWEQARLQKMVRDDAVTP